MSSGKKGKYVYENVLAVEDENYEMMSKKHGILNPNFT
jgi:hypothetical protein